MIDRAGIVIAGAQPRLSLEKGDPVQGEFSHFRGGGVEVDHIGHIAEHHPGAICLDAKVDANMAASGGDAVGVEAGGGRFRRRGEEAREESADPGQHMTWCVVCNFLLIR